MFKSFHLRLFSLKIKHDFLKCYRSNKFPIFFFFLHPIVEYYSIVKPVLFCSFWKFINIFSSKLWSEGVGIANNMIASMCNIYYCVIVCWAMFYVISTFTTHRLPWQTCERSWNDRLCWEASSDNSSSALKQSRNELMGFNESQSPVTQFWE